MEIFKKRWELASLVACVAMVGGIIYVNFGVSTDDFSASVPAVSVLGQDIDAQGAATPRPVHALNVHEGLLLSEDIEKPLDLPVPSQVELCAVLPDVAGPINDWREYKPSKIRVATNPGLIVDFDIVSVREEHGRTMMTGRNSSLPGTFFTSVGTENDWHAIMSVVGLGSYKLRATNAQITIEEQNRPVACAMEHPAASPFARAEDPSKSDSHVTTADAPAPLGESALFVDLLFFYDEPLAEAEDRSNIVSEFLLQVNAANLILENSEINNFRWRYIDAYEAPGYSATQSMENDLNQMSDPTTTLGAFVQKKRRERVVDQCVLYVKNTRTDAAGIAWMPGHELVVGWESYGVATYKTLTHELGHNFGCHHDRITAGVSDGNGAYNYGWSIKESGTYIGTVMSYAATVGTPPDYPEEFPYFSNPSLMVDGYVIGYEATHPKAADNARVMRDSAPAMAAAGSPAERPWISQQPQSVTVFKGNAFSLSVTAASNPSDGALRFQWKKGIADIAGATGETLAFGSASVNMNGIYYVVVSNDAGSVTSRPATVLVSTIDVPTTYTESGGGAPSTLYFAAFGLLLAIQTIINHRYGKRC